LQTDRQPCGSTKRRFRAELNGSAHAWAQEESEPETAKLCMLARLAIRLHMDSEGTWDMLKTLRFRHVRHQPLEADASELLVECRYAESLESTRRKLLAGGLPPSYGGGQRVPDDNEPGHHSGSAPSGAAAACIYRLAICQCKTSKERHCRV